MSYEDEHLNEDFRTESPSAFRNDLCEEELYFLDNQSNLKQCSGCGEYVSELYGIDGICHLCNQSEEHAYKRSVKRKK